jgi:hypothetical protein
METKEKPAKNDEYVQVKKSDLEKIMELLKELKD